MNINALDFIWIFQKSTNFFGIRVGLLGVVKEKENNNLIFLS